jgi:DNA modification methylase
LIKTPSSPIVDTQNGKASSANQFPFHNWYNFVLGYSPQFPNFMLDREKVTNSDFVIDPFMGTGTTMIACKQRGIRSLGVDANDFMVDTARVKLNWTVDIRALKIFLDKLIERVQYEFQRYPTQVQLEPVVLQQGLFDIPKITGDGVTHSWETLVKRRPSMLLPKYISDKPLGRLFIIADAIKTETPIGEIQNFFNLALDSLIVPVSNVRYGPGFGMIKPKTDMPVLELFIEKANRMIRDLQGVSPFQAQTYSEVVLGDTRQLLQFCKPNSATFMITSPPYPGDHEYTKHTRLELLFRGYATTHEQFQVIKRRMIRASTTNIYREDQEGSHVRDLTNLQNLTQLIQDRLDEDSATSGFEKLYTKLVWEYFGGMDRALRDCLKVLQPGGKIALLVSDSHAFKMVHIETAALLREIGIRVGFQDSEIILWQFKPSTSHQYALRENILILTK